MKERGRGRRKRGKEENRKRGSEREREREREIAGGIHRNHKIYGLCKFSSPTFRISAFSELC